jgi:hypothetical protein
MAYEGLIHQHPAPCARGNGLSGNETLCCLSDDIELWRNHNKFHEPTVTSSIVRLSGVPEYSEVQ